MFEDRIELCSPGSLPNNLTVESMGERQSTRNEVLTSVLGRMGVGGASKGLGGVNSSSSVGVTVCPSSRRETQELSGRLPEFRMIDGAELCLTVPAAPLESSPANTVITVHCDGRPLGEVDVLALFPNNTWQHASTNERGEARLRLHSTHLPMTVFIRRRWRMLPLV